MVKPGGTGSPSLVMPWRLAPLPPRSSFMPSAPSALPPPKDQTRRDFPDIEAATPLLEPAFELFFDVAADVFSTDPFLDHAVSVADGDGVMFESVIIDRDSEGGSDFVLATV